MGIPSSGSIIVDNDSVRLFDARRLMLWQFRWTEIVKICAWKDDVLAFDIVCIGFLVEGSEKYLRCDEHNDGWDELHRHLLRLYNLRLEDWWPTVALPAFVENLTVLWER